MLNIQSCLERQKRLLSAMEQAHLDFVVLGYAKSVYYFTGALVDASRPQVFAMDASGRSLLITNREPDQSAAGETKVYTAYTIERPFGRTSMNDEAAALLHSFAPPTAGSTGIDSEHLNAALAAAAGGRTQRNISPLLEQIRRRKDLDELECMRSAITLAEAGYKAIKARLEPGMTEFEAYSIIHEAMVRAAGTSVDLGGDFACGERGIKAGGPPTERKVLAGDLYIFDLFPARNGYSCDLCRTFAVGKPTELQQQAWSHVMEAHSIAEKVIRPGASGRDVYEALRRHMEAFEPARGSFYHHAGHGLGMDAWERPWLTPGSEDIIEEGDVVACEPGLYGENLQGGIRLEHNYLVGKSSAVPLDTFPMDL